MNIVLADGTQLVTGMYLYVAFNVGGSKYRLQRMSTPDSPAQLEFNSADVYLLKHGCKIRLEHCYSTVGSALDAIRAKSGVGEVPLVSADNYIYTAAGTFYNVTKWGRGYLIEPFVPYRDEFSVDITAENNTLVMTNCFAKRYNAIDYVHEELE